MVGFSQTVGYTRPDKQALLDAYLGLPIPSLPTPSCIVNRRTAKSNCDAMLSSAARLGVPFRAHIKTHKTLEGLRLQLADAGHGRIIVSTIMEAVSVLPLVEEGLVTDILYGLPLVPSRIPELEKLRDLVPNVRLMIDSEDQLAALSKLASPSSKRWGIFIKVDCGYHRAGLPVSSPFLESLIRVSLASPMIDVFGFYCHAGQSYGSKSVEDAKSTLLSELRCSLSAAQFASSIADRAYTISVGATPTAHASSHLSSDELDRLVSSFTSRTDGAEAGAQVTVELHAGCYPFNDLQQFATSLVPPSSIAIRVLSECVSKYHDRNEILINAGCCALSRETGPVPGFGAVVARSGSWKQEQEEGRRSDDVDGGERDWVVGQEDWQVSRISQEHGLLSPTNNTATTGAGGDGAGKSGSGGGVNDWSVGDKLLIVPQHACITSSGHAWYFIIDDDAFTLHAKVVDVWIRFGGW